jgi:hypothetical protein
MIVAMAPRNVLVGRRPRKDAAAAPGAGPGDCGFRVAPEGPVLMDEATASATLPRKGVGRSICASVNPILRNSS